MSSNPTANFRKFHCTLYIHVHFVLKRRHFMPTRRKTQFFSELQAPAENSLVYCWPQRNVNNYLLRYSNTLTYLLTYLEKLQATKMIGMIYYQFQGYILLTYVLNLTKYDSLFVFLTGAPLPGSKFHIFGARCPIPRAEHSTGHAATTRMAEPFLWMNCAIHKCG